MVMLLLLLVSTCSLSAGCVPSSQRKQSAAVVYVQPPVDPMARTTQDNATQTDGEGERESLRLRDAIAVILRHHDQEEQRNNGSTTSRRR